MTANNNVDEALNNLIILFPSLERTFLEDVYVSSKKDFDKTVDTLLSMGVDMEVGKKDQKLAPAPISSPLKPQNNPLPTYPSSLLPHQVSSPQLPPPISPNVPPPLQPAISAPLPVLSNPPVGYPPRDLHTMYTTPPPIMTSTPVPTSPTPTAPPSTNLNSSQVDQKRMETMKQELALEYQRINDKHKYNLELQQKLEQLSEFTSSEQRKLEEQRALFAEEKRRFTEELSTRFKALEEDFQSQKDELQQQEERRVTAARDQEQAKAEAKEDKRRLKEQRKSESERQRLDADVERTEQLEIMTKRLHESQKNLEDVLKEKNDQIQAIRNTYDAETESLKERVKQLERQLKTSEYNTSAEVLSYFSTVVSTLAGGIHAVSLERANNTGGEQGGSGEGLEESGGEALKELKRTFFRTINDQFNNKLREIDEQ